MAGWDQLPDLRYHILSPSGLWLYGVKQWVAHHQSLYYHQKNCIEAAWPFLVKFSGLVSAVALFSSLAALQPQHAVDEKRRHHEDSPKLRPSSVNCVVSYPSARMAQTKNRKRCFTASILTGVVAFAASFFTFVLFSLQIDLLRAGILLRNKYRFLTTTNSRYDQRCLQATIRHRGYPEKNRYTTVMSLSPED